MIRDELKAELREEFMVSFTAQITKIRNEVKDLKVVEYEHPASIVKNHAEAIDIMLVDMNDYKEYFYEWITNEEPRLYYQLREVGLYPILKHMLWEANGRIASLQQQLESSKKHLQDLYEWYALKEQ